MPRLIPSPTSIPVPGGKLIDEYVGGVNTQTDSISIAHMRAPAGWEEPFQTPAFDEYTLVLKGSIRVEHEGGQTDVAAGQAILTSAGERIRYSTLEECEYVAVCLPAFSPGRVQREDA
jgi:quercetin dioxygenase-like cupin family protein